MPASNAAVSQSPAVQAATPRTPDPSHLPAAAPPNWSRLVRRYGRPLRAIARRLLRMHGMPARAEDVQELMQDLWCRVFERAPGAVFANADDGTMTYLGTALRNLASDRVRAASAAKRGGFRRRVSLGSVGALPTADPSPEERLLGREERHRLLARIRPLASTSRRRRDLMIFERALLDGWSSRQIARALGGALAPSSIDSLVHRLRRDFADEGIELPRRNCGSG